MLFRLRLVMFAFVVLLVSCNGSYGDSHNFKSVEVTNIYVKKGLSVRALEILSEDTLGLGFNNGFGVLKHNGSFFSPEQLYFNFPTLIQDSIIKNLAFRSVAYNGTKLFALSIENPAALVCLDVSVQNPELSIVYEERHPDVFYDALTFWNSSEGIAIGDPTDGCLSIILTSDGGRSWQKVLCEDLPATKDGEAAFAASNTNVKVLGDAAWIISGGMASRVYYTPDKGNTWTVYDTPLIQGKPTTGGYSIDFYDAENGVIVGGDYTSPDNQDKNKAVTKDGGKTWSLVADGEGIGYKSCVQYVPNSNARELVAVGVTGISYSKNGGKKWRKLSSEEFYSIRFLNDTVAYASGKERVAKLIFK